MSIITNSIYCKIQSSVELTIGEKKAYRNVVKGGIKAIRAYLHSVSGSPDVKHNLMLRLLKVTVASK